MAYYDGQYLDLLQELIFDKKNNQVISDQNSHVRVLSDENDQVIRSRRSTTALSVVPDPI